MRNDNILFGFLCAVWVGLMSSWILSIGVNNMSGASAVHVPVLFHMRHF